MTESNEAENRRWPTRRFEVIFWIVFVIVLIVLMALFWLFLGVGVDSPPGSHS